MRIIFLCSLILFSLLTSSCSNSTPPPTPQVVSVFSSSFTQPWLTELYACAGSSAIIRLSDSASASVADIRLQLGEPEWLTGFAYQIDEEEILIVTNRVSPIQNLTPEQAKELFMGLGNPTVQVWVYASGTDGQNVFEQLVMDGRTVTLSVNIASTPQQMSDILVNQENTAGILPRHWKAGDVRDVFSAGKVPVLALTNVEPQGVVKELIGCLQK